MSLENVELHRAAIKAFNARDLDTLLALCDPAVEFHSAFAAVGGAVYRGHDGIRSWHRDVEEVWGEEVRIEPKMYFDLGEQVLGFSTLHGRGRHSGAEVAMPGALLTTWQEGLIVQVRGYGSREDALSDLGISERVLEPIQP